MPCQLAGGCLIVDIKKLTVRLSRLTDSLGMLEKAVAYAFINENGYDTSNSSFLNNYFGDLDYTLANKATSIITEVGITLTIYALVEIFELLLPKDIKKENGMVYTPTEIKNYIISEVLSTDNIPTVCDPACGCGSFLLSAAEFVKKSHGLSYDEIFSKHIFGVDIVEHNIEKCKVLFNLLAIASNETLSSELNIKVASSLSLDWRNEFKCFPKGGFDAVIGNPPYVRSRNVTGEVRKEMNVWQTAKIGNADLYIPFYELGIELLCDRGKLGYISPNTFIQSVNGRSLRRYLLDSGFSISILDFRETQVFKNVTSYTCITIVDKSRQEGSIRYALLNGKRSLSDYSFTEYSEGSFMGYAPWRMSEKDIDFTIKKIESAGIKLDSYKIRNGLATLKNDIYFFMPASEDEHYFYRQYNGITYPIEKAICIDVAKPNVIRTEKELAEKMEKAIFPYYKNGNGFVVIDEGTMIASYPCAYKFFLAVKQNLLKRDKGNGNYATWYAYGRTQGMTNFGSKLLIPYISDTPIAVLSMEDAVLFYCGYAVFSDDVEELAILKRFLESKVFWYYILHTSKPYAKGYMSFAKNYIKNFGMPKLDALQKQRLLSLKEKEEIDAYIQKLYDIAI